jgi:hypothetical protein
VEHERWGTPVASYVAGLPPDARPLDRGKPRDEDTEGGSQPADKSLINRRLSLHSQPCAAMAFLADGELAEQTLHRASPLDREHKRLVDGFRGARPLALTEYNMAVDEEIQDLVQRRAESDAVFAESLVREGIETILAGDVNSGKARSCATIKATRRACSGRR